MASVRFADMQSRPVEFLDFTSLTLDEFQHITTSQEAYQNHRLRNRPGPVLACREARLFH